MVVRRANVGELEQLKHLRLQALLDAPGAFGSTYAEEAERDPATWRPWVTDGCTFVVTDEGGWHGLAAVFIDPRDPSLCHLVSMWVDPVRRGRGWGRELLGAGIEWARQQRATALRLGVVDGNQAAARLYRQAGFEPTGEREPLRSDPGQTIMFLLLDLRTGPE